MFPDSDIVHIISFQVLKNKNSVFVLEWFISHVKLFYVYDEQESN